MNLSVVIPTLGRDEVLVETINYLLNLSQVPDEILIVDQTDVHAKKIEDKLLQLHHSKKIVWKRIKFKSITHAMNIALREAKNERVLFLDDDIIPDDNLITAHIQSSIVYPSAIIAGRVLQPWHNGNADASETHFLFNSLVSREVDSFMGGNVSMPRISALELGGFDTNFVKVAYHFEAEFAYRWVSSGKRIFYNPDALIHHLKTARGGTRSYGNHLQTIKPDHAVGRYYYYLRRYRMRQGLTRSLQELSTVVVTKHHLRKPHWIPLTFIAELSGLLWALVLYYSGKGTIASKKKNLLILSSHPIQYYSPIFARLNKLTDFQSRVLYLTLPDSRSQSLGFKKNFTWDIPLLHGYHYSVAKSYSGKGLIHGFFGVKLKNPIEEVKLVKEDTKPDAVLVTGWHFWGMVQMFLAFKIANIPIILRMDSNSIRNRLFIFKWIYKLFFSWVDICLTVGEHNKIFCVESGMNEDRIISSPHIVDNDFFFQKSKEAKLSYNKIRNNWGVPNNVFCFLYAGKLQKKKRPLDLLKAFRMASSLSKQPLHLLVVGTGDLEQKCKSYVSKYNLSVTFVGFLNQTEIPNAYAICDAIVLPSDQGETWGLVINEAMACGLPAIVSDLVGCAPDLVHDHYTGFTFKCGDVNALAKHLIFLAENPDYSKKLGENANKLVHKDYSISKVVESIEKAMLSLNG
jgi:glycosyltransferase involved in cell wall biosynthesis